MDADTTETETTETAEEVGSQAAEPAAAAAAEATPEKSWAQEIAEAAGQAATTAAAGAQVEEAKPDDKPADEEKEEPAPDDEKKTEEPAKPAAKEDKPQGDMAKRLALVADGNRKNELRAKELDTRETKLQERFKPLEDLAGRIRAVGTDRVAVTRELVGGEDELQSLYLELSEHFHGGDGDDKKPAKPTAKPLTLEDVNRLVKEGVKAEVEQLGKAELAREQGDYVQSIRETLDANPGSYPHCFSAPPSDRAIAAISDAIERAKGRKPSAETVLKAIEDHRSERHAKATGKKTDQTEPSPKKPAAAAEPSKTSGEKPKPAIRGNDVPVVKPTPKTFSEEVDELAARVNRQAAEAQA